jgi:hypothetical protein
MFPLWFTFLGGSFVFLDVGHVILFFVFPFFGCFGLFTIGKVSSIVHRCGVINVFIIIYLLCVVWL